MTHYFWYKTVDEVIIMRYTESDQNLMVRSRRDPTKWYHHALLNPSQFKEYYCHNCRPLTLLERCLEGLE